MYKVFSYGKEYDVTVTPKKYVSGGLALKMDCLDDEFGCMMPFATLTVNLKNNLPEDHAFVDTNNCPWAEKFIEENGLGEFAGRYGSSGFCSYPLYKFYLDKIGG